MSCNFRSTTQSTCTIRESRGIHVGENTTALVFVVGTSEDPHDPRPRCSQKGSRALAWCDGLASGILGFGSHEVMLKLMRAQPS